MTEPCTQVHAVVDEVAVGAAWPDDLAVHVSSCSDCQARLVLARRIDEALATWPIATPPPGFAARVAASARREALAQDVVVDWGFNLAIAGCVAVIFGGAVAGLWMMSTAVPMTDSSRVAADVLTAVVDRARAQASVAVTAMALLVTAVGGWWWAEQQSG